MRNSVRVADDDHCRSLVRGEGHTLLVLEMPIERSMSVSRAREDEGKRT